MKTTLATCSRCAWTYTPGEHGPIVALRDHWWTAHRPPRPYFAYCTAVGCSAPSDGRALCAEHYRDTLPGGHR